MALDMAAFGNPVKPSQFLNSGDSDVSPDGTPSQFLLFRGLEPTVTEDLLAKGAAKLFKPSGRSPPPAAPVVTKKGPAKVASTTGDANLGAKEGTIRRILLVRDRRSNESWRYGFVEFGTVDVSYCSFRSLNHVNFHLQDAQAALTRYNSFDKFTISSKPVTVDYVHAGIFVPVFEVSPETERFSFSPFSNAATRLAYWDDNAYVSELVVSIPDNERGFNTSEAHAKSATDKAAAAAEKEGLVKPGKGTEAKAKKRKAEANAAAKQKKVWTCCSSNIMKRGLIPPDCTGPFTVLVQSACRASRCEIRRNVRGKRRRQRGRRDPCTKQSSDNRKQ